MIHIITIKSLNLVQSEKIHKEWMIQAQVEVPLKLLIMDMMGKDHIESLEISKCLIVKAKEVTEMKKLAIVEKINDMIVQNNHYSLDIIQ